ncbi:MAG: glycosyltransferase [Oscillatoria sp. SIO1A7]|nr:glycosyltransferase [Oscillatoria sp. SIO1A7]
MTEPKLNVMQISGSEISGGAERVALMLHDGYRQYGHNAWLAVGKKKSQDPNVLVIPNDEYLHLWAKQCNYLANLLSPWVNRVKGAWRTQNLITYLGQPRRWLEVVLGHEFFDFPGTEDLLKLSPQRPHILHGHNLHAGYFDLRALSGLSQQVPVVITMHDAWLLSGHCGHSFDCDRWKTGCGQCPDLNIHPPIARDATAYNWQRKKDIYANSKLYIATPSRWLRQKAEQSMLAPAVVEYRTIPNGIDLSVFQPADKKAVRAELGIPTDTKALLFTANGIRKNSFKDYQTMQAAVARIAENLESQNVLFIALGEAGPVKQIGRAKIQFLPFEKDPKAVARYYQAADVYVHAAKADTFPNTVLEALACGTPVVATAVGGIPEQVDDGITGFLVAPGDATGLAESIQTLLEDENKQKEMSDRAAEAAQQKFDSQRMIHNYLEWYVEILDNRQNN